LEIKRSQGLKAVNRVLWGLYVLFIVTVSGLTCYKGYGILL